MKKHLSRSLLCFLPFILSLPSLNYAEDLSDNLVCDGGMEEWLENGPDAASVWNYLTIQCKGTEFTKNAKGNYLLPKIHGQINEGCKLLQLEDKDAHSGRKALRLHGGNLYLSLTSPDAYKTKDGDVYVIRFWAKGEGAARIYLHVYGEGCAEILSEKGTLRKDSWSLIEERVLVTGRAPTGASPRLTAWPHEVLFDDIFIGRVIREGERKLTEVPQDCQERVAFASDAEGKITIDGKLDEPAWNKAMKFAGFRPYAEQSWLAPASAAFRVLFDAENIYFAVEIPLTNCPQVLRELQAQPLTDGAGKPLAKTDAYTARESVELFVQPSGTGRYFQFVASLDGYRYDGAEKDGAWNGTWESAVAVAPDRWFLEVRVSLGELGRQPPATTAAWGLNVCVNQNSGAKTWSAIGAVFHRPENFGKLIFGDFAKWRGQRAALNAASKQWILREAGPLRNADRLAALDAFARKGAAEGAFLDWESITRTYSRLNHVDYSLRCMEEELRFRNYFGRKTNER
ncbi:MAG: hypothetical protein HY360_22670 [Verrucomicrobia bacterium]|nr:hypothetical protein [Verrucomicrobiota bacterium]